MSRGYAGEQKFKPAPPDNFVNFHISASAGAYLVTVRCEMQMLEEKLLLFSLLNLAALVILVLRLAQQGHPLAVALRATWRLVVSGTRNDLEIPRVYPAWAGLLAKTWWIMNLIYLCGMIWFREPCYGWAALGSGILHLIWYFGGYLGTEAYNRTILLDRRFGVVFHKIGLTAECCGKSLAELDLRKKELLVLAIERGGKMLSFPKGLELIEPGDRLVIFGDLNSFRAIFHYEPSDAD